MFFLSADYGLEKFLKKLVGRKDDEDAVLRLDMLTKEESLMVMARNLEVTQATKVLVENNVKRIEGVARSVDNGTQHFLSIFVHIPILFCIST